MGDKVARARIAVFGDAHIPDRATEIPSEILKWLEQHKPFDIAIYTGDLTGREVLEFIKSLAPRRYVVAGNMDWLDLPEYEIVDLWGVKLGVVHGDQVYPRGNIPKLTRLARRLGVNVLISGHTHDPFIAVYEGIIHLNPGSITGVPSGGGGSLIPSLMYVELDDNHNLYVELYELREGVLEKSRVERFRVVPLQTSV